MKKIARGLLALATGALLVVTPVNPALAEPGTTPTHYSWGCVAGTLTTNYIRDDYEDDGFILGSFYRCSSLYPYAVFASAVYDANGTVEVKLLSLPTSTSPALGSIPVHLSATTVGACVIKGETARVACVSVDPDHQLTQIPVTDPRVQAYAWVDMQITPETGPGCMTCD